jgi:ABC-type spermidine/putrescine transport system permease subunit I
MDKIGQALTAFGRFWWEFLIGENPDAFFGALVTIGVALALRHDRAAAVTVVPLIALAVLIASTYRGRKRAAARPDGSAPTKS